MRLAEKLQSKGHLRVEAAPSDVSYDVVSLARSFRDVAFSYEFHFQGKRLVNERLEKPLKRWHGVIRYKMDGDGVTDADRDEVAALTARLSALTGLAFVPSSTDHDMLITIASAADRDRISRNLSERDHSAYQERYDIWRATPGWLCGATLSSSDADPGRLVFAHIFIAAEITGVLRRSCLHEEITQSLGLTNDSETARPSIFNDDHEFAVLTRHDETLLRVLYDPRLDPGMSAVEAMPIARRILNSMESALHDL
ncbi:MAG: DUF2927 domain-containing protein [Pseudomonadota bacterium]